MINVQGSEHAMPRELRIALLSIVGLGFVGAGFAIVAGPASADVCRNPDQSVGHTIHDTLVHNPTLRIEKFVGADAQVGIAAYNRLPEPGHDRGDTFYIAFDAHSHTAYMAV